MKKVVTFLLPGGSKEPVGGYKVVYEYANRLINDGYNVNIVFPATLLWKEQSIKEKIKGIVKYFYFGIFKGKYLPYNWFPLNKNIKIYWTPTLEEKYIPKSDYIFATAWQTAEYLNKYSNLREKNFYLIQHYELWGCSEERLLNTWKMPLKKIVISNWLKKIGDNLGETTYLINNGLDFNKFGRDIYIEDRNPKNILLLYHESEWKGFRYGLEALKIVKEKYNDIEVNCFGAFKNPKNLPSWINYYYSPAQNKLRELYNNASVFVGTSLGEGWGLTVSEAMQCGCAVACTDVVGYKEVAHQYRTALLCESKNGKALAENIIKLISNNELRRTIADNGYFEIQQYTWEIAYGKLKHLLEQKEI